MMPIYAGLSIFDPNVAALDTGERQAMPVAEASETFFQRFVDMQESFLEARHSQLPDTSRNPAYRNYATVSVNGKIVAEIDNRGGVVASNPMGAKTDDLIAGEVGDSNGPRLAQERAERIAEALGGTVHISSTAMTQEQFNSTPQPQAAVDYQALMEDPLYKQLQQIKQARALFLTQRLAQEPAQAAVTEEADSAQSTDSDSGAVNAFLEYMSKTPEERFFEALLAEEGLTKEQFDALPEDERAKIEAIIRDKIRKHMENKLVGAA